MSQSSINDAIYQPPCTNAQSTVLISSISSPIMSTFVQSSPKSYLSLQQCLSERNISINTPSTNDPPNFNFSLTDVIFVSKDIYENLPGPYSQDSTILKYGRKRYMQIHQPYYNERLTRQVVSVLKKHQCYNYNENECGKLTLFKDFTSLLTTHNVSFDPKTLTYEPSPLDFKSASTDDFVTTNNEIWPSEDQHATPSIIPFSLKTSSPIDLKIFNQNNILRRETLNFPIESRNLFTNNTNAMNDSYIMNSTQKYNSFCIFSKQIWNWKTTRKKTYF